jgi:hypothetical protein
MPKPMDDSRLRSGIPDISAYRGETKEPAGHLSARPVDAAVTEALAGAASCLMRAPAPGRWWYATLTPVCLYFDPLYIVMLPISAALVRFPLAQRGLLL